MADINLGEIEIGNISVNVSTANSMSTAKSQKSKESESPAVVLTVGADDWNESGIQLKHGSTFDLTKNVHPVTKGDSNTNDIAGHNTDKKTPKAGVLEIAGDDWNDSGIQLEPGSTLETAFTYNRNTRNTTNESKTRDKSPAAGGVLEISGEDWNSPRVGIEPKSNLEIIGDGIFPRKGDGDIYVTASSTLHGLRNGNVKGGQEIMSPSGRVLPKSQLLSASSSKEKSQTGVALVTQQVDKSPSAARREQLIASVTNSKQVVKGTGLRGTTPFTTNTRPRAATGGPHRSESLQKSIERKSGATPTRVVQKPSSPQKTQSKGGETRKTPSKDSVVSREMSTGSRPPSTTRPSSNTRRSLPQSGTPGGTKSHSQGLGSARKSTDSVGDVDRFFTEEEKGTTKPKKAFGTDKSKISGGNTPRPVPKKKRKDPRVMFPAKNYTAAIVQKAHKNSHGIGQEALQNDGLGLADFPQDIFVTGVNATIKIKDDVASEDKVTISHEISSSEGQSILDNISAKVLSNMSGDYPALSSNTATSKPLTNKGSKENGDSVGDRPLSSDAIYAATLTDEYLSHEEVFGTAGSKGTADGVAVDEFVIEPTGPERLLITEGSSDVEGSHGRQDRHFHDTANKGVTMMHSGMPPKPSDSEDHASNKTTENADLYAHHDHGKPPTGKKKQNSKKTIEELQASVNNAAATAKEVSERTRKNFKTNMASKGTSNSSQPTNATPRRASKGRADPSRKFESPPMLSKVSEKSRPRTLQASQPGQRKQTPKGATSYWAGKAKASPVTEKFAPRPRLDDEVQSMDTVLIDHENLGSPTSVNQNQNMRNQSQNPHAEATFSPKGKKHPKGKAKNHAHGQTGKRGYGRSVKSPLKDNGHGTHDHVGHSTHDAAQGPSAKRKPSVEKRIAAMRNSVGKVQSDQHRQDEENRVHGKAHSQSPRQVPPKIGANINPTYTIPANMSPEDGDNESLTPVSTSRKPKPEHNRKQKHKAHGNSKPSAAPNVVAPNTSSGIGSNTETSLVNGQKPLQKKTSDQYEYPANLASIDETAVSPSGYEPDRDPYSNLEGGNAGRGGKATEKKKKMAKVGSGKTGTSTSPRKVDQPKVIKSGDGGRGTFGERQYHAHNTVTPGPKTGHVRTTMRIKNGGKHSPGMGSIQLSPTSPDHHRPHPPSSARSGGSPPTAETSPTDNGTLNGAIKKGMKTMERGRSRDIAAAAAMFEEELRLEEARDEVPLEESPLWNGNSTRDPSSLEKQPSIKSRQGSMKLQLSREQATSASMTKQQLNKSLGTQMSFGEEVKNKKEARMPNNGKSSPHGKISFASSGLVMLRQSMPGNYGHKGRATMEVKDGKAVLSSPVSGPRNKKGSQMMSQNRSIGGKKRRRRKDADRDDHDYSPESEIISGGAYGTASTRIPLLSRGNSGGTRDFFDESGIGSGIDDRMTTQIAVPLKASPKSSTGLTGSAPVSPKGAEQKADKFLCTPDGTQQLQESNAGDNGPLNAMGKGSPPNTREDSRFKPTYGNWMDDKTRFSKLKRVSPQRVPISGTEADAENSIATNADSRLSFKKSISASSPVKKSASARRTPRRSPSQVDIGSPGSGSRTLLERSGSRTLGRSGSRGSTSGGRKRGKKGGVKDPNAAESIEIKDALGGGDAVCGGEKHVDRSGISVAFDGMDFQKLENDAEERIKAEDRHHKEDLILKNIRHKVEEAAGRAELLQAEVRGLHGLDPAKAETDFHPYTAETHVKEDLIREFEHLQHPRQQELQKHLHSDLYTLGWMDNPWANVNNVLSSNLLDTTVPQTGPQGAGQVAKTEAVPETDADKTKRLEEMENYINQMQDVLMQYLGGGDGTTEGLDHRKTAAIAAAGIQSGLTAEQIRKTVTYLSPNLKAGGQQNAGDQQGQHNGNQSHSDPHDVLTRLTQKMVMSPRPGARKSVQMSPNVRQAQVGGLANQIGTPMDMSNMNPQQQQYLQALQRQIQQLQSIAEQSKQIVDELGQSGMSPLREQGMQINTTSFPQQSTAAANVMSGRDFTDTAPPISLGGKSGSTNGNAKANRLPLFDYDRMRVQKHIAGYGPSAHGSDAGIHEQLAAMHKNPQQQPQTLRNTVGSISNALKAHYSHHSNIASNVLNIQQLPQSPRGFTHVNSCSPERDDAQPLQQQRQMQQAVMPQQGGVPMQFGAGQKPQYGIKPMQQRSYGQKMPGMPQYGEQLEPQTAIGQQQLQEFQQYEQQKNLEGEEQYGEQDQMQGMMQQNQQQMQQNPISALFGMYNPQLHQQVNLPHAIMDPAKSMKAYPRGNIFCDKALEDQLVPWNQLAEDRVRTPVSPLCTSLPEQSINQIQTPERIESPSPGVDGYGLSPRSRALQFGPPMVLTCNDPNNRNANGAASFEKIKSFIGGTTGGGLTLGSPSINSMNTRPGKNTNSKGLAGAGTLQKGGFPQSGQLPGSVMFGAEKSAFQAARDVMGKLNREQIELGDRQGREMMEVLFSPNSNMKKNAQTQEQLQPRNQSPLMLPILRDGFRLEAGTVVNSSLLTAAKTGKNPNLLARDIASPLDGAKNQQSLQQYGKNEFEGPANESEHNITIDLQGEDASALGLKDSSRKLSVLGNQARRGSGIGEYVRRGSKNKVELTPVKLDGALRRKDSKDRVDGVEPKDRNGSKERRGSISQERRGSHSRGNSQGEDESKAEGHSARRKHAKVVLVAGRPKQRPGSPARSDKSGRRPGDVFSQTESPSASPVSKTKSSPSSPARDRGVNPKHGTRGRRRNHSKSASKGRAEKAAADLTNRPAWEGPLEGVDGVELGEDGLPLVRSVVQTGIDDSVDQIKHGQAFVQSPLLPAGEMTRPSILGNLGVKPNLLLPRPSISLQGVGHPASARQSSPPPGQQGKAVQQGPQQGTGAILTGATSLTTVPAQPGAVLQFNAQLMSPRMSVFGRLSPPGPMSPSELHHLVDDAKRQNLYQQEKERVGCIKPTAEPSPVMGTSIEGSQKVPFSPSLKESLFHDLEKSLENMLNCSKRKYEDEINRLRDMSPESLRPWSPTSEKESRKENKDGESPSDEKKSRSQDNQPYPSPARATFGILSPPVQLGRGPYIGVGHDPLRRDPIHHVGHPRVAGHPHHAPHHNQHPGMQFHLPQDPQHRGGISVFGHSPPEATFQHMLRGKEPIIPFHPHAHIQGHYDVQGHHIDAHDNPVDAHGHPLVAGKHGKHHIVSAYNPITHQIMDQHGHSAHQHGQPAHQQLGQHPAHQQPGHQLIADDHDGHARGSGPKAKHPHGKAKAKAKKGSGKRRGGSDVVEDKNQPGHGVDTHRAAPHGTGINGTIGTHIQEGQFIPARGDDHLAHSGEQEIGGPLQMARLQQVIFSPTRVLRNANGMNLNASPSIAGIAPLPQSQSVSPVSPRGKADAKPSMPMPNMPGVEGDAKPRMPNNMPGNMPNIPGVEGVQSLLRQQLIPDTNVNVLSTDGPHLLEDCGISPIGVEKNADGSPKSLRDYHEDLKRRVGGSPAMDFLDKHMVGDKAFYPPQWGKGTIEEQTHMKQKSEEHERQLAMEKHHGAHPHGDHPAAHKQSPHSPKDNQHAVQNARIEPSASAGLLASPGGTVAKRKASPRRRAGVTDKRTSVGKSRSDDTVAGKAAGKQSPTNQARAEPTSQGSDADRIALVEDEAEMGLKDEIQGGAPSFPGPIEAGLGSNFSTAQQQNAHGILPGNFGNLIFLQTGASNLQNLPIARKAPTVGTSNLPNGASNTRNRSSSISLVQTNFPTMEEMKRRILADQERVKKQLADEKEAHKQRESERAEKAKKSYPQLNFQAPTIAGNKESLLMDFKKRVSAGGDSDQKRVLELMNHTKNIIRSVSPKLGKATLTGIPPTATQAGSKIIQFDFAGKMTFGSKTTEFVSREAVQNTGPEITAEVAENIREMERVSGIRPGGLTFEKTASSKTSCTGMLSQVGIPHIETSVPQIPDQLRIKPVELQDIESRKKELDAKVAQWHEEFAARERQKSELLEQQRRSVTEANSKLGRVLGKGLEDFLPDVLKNAVQKDGRGKSIIRFNSTGGINTTGVQNRLAVGNGLLNRKIVPGKSLLGKMRMSAVARAMDASPSDGQIGLEQIGDGLGLGIPQSTPAQFRDLATGTGTGQERNSAYIRSVSPTFLSRMQQPKLDLSALTANIYSPTLRTRITMSPKRNPNAETGQTPRQVVHVSSPQKIPARSESPTPNKKEQVLKSSASSPGQSPIKKMGVIPETSDTQRNFEPRVIKQTTYHISSPKDGLRAKDAPNQPPLTVSKGTAVTLSPNAQPVQATIVGGVNHGSPVAVSTMVGGVRIISPLGQGILNGFSPNAMRQVLNGQAVTEGRSAVGRPRSPAEQTAQKGVYQVPVTPEPSQHAHLSPRHDSPGAIYTAGDGGKHTGGGYAISPIGFPLPEQKLQDLISQMPESERMKMIELNNTAAYNKNAAGIANNIQNSGQKPGLNSLPSLNMPITKITQPNAATNPTGFGTNSGTKPVSNFTVSQIQNAGQATFKDKDVNTGAQQLLGSQRLSLNAGLNYNNDIGKGLSKVVSPAAQKQFNSMPAQRDDDPFGDEFQVYNNPDAKGLIKQQPKPTGSKDMRPLGSKDAGDSNTSTQSMIRGFALGPPDGRDDTDEEVLPQDDLDTKVLKIVQENPGIGFNMAAALARSPQFTETGMVSPNIMNTVTKLVPGNMNQIGQDFDFGINRKLIMTDTPGSPEMIPGVGFVAVTGAGGISSGPVSPDSGVSVGSPTSTEGSVDSETKRVKLLTALKELEKNNEIDTDVVLNKAREIMTCNNEAELVERGRFLAEKMMESLTLASLKSKDLETLLQDLDEATIEKLIREELEAKNGDGQAKGKSNDSSQSVALAASIAKVIAKANQEAEENRAKGGNLHEDNITATTASEATRGAFTTPKKRASKEKEETPIKRASKERDISASEPASPMSMKKTKSILSKGDKRPKSGSKGVKIFEDDDDGTQGKPSIAGSTKMGSGSMTGSPRVSRRGPSVSGMLTGAAKAQLRSKLSSNAPQRATGLNPKYIQQITNALDILVQKLDQEIYGISDNGLRASSTDDLDSSFGRGGAGSSLSEAAATAAAARTPRTNGGSTVKLGERSEKKNVENIVNDLFDGDNRGRRSGDNIKVKSKPAGATNASGLGNQMIQMRNKRSIVGFMGRLADFLNTNEKGQDDEGNPITSSQDAKKNTDLNRNKSQSPGGNDRETRAQNAAATAGNEGKKSSMIEKSASLAQSKKRWAASTTASAFGGIGRNSSPLKKNIGSKETAGSKGSKETSGSKESRESLSKDGDPSKETGSKDSRTSKNNPEDSLDRPATDPEKLITAASFLVEGEEDSARQEAVKKSRVDSSRVDSQESTALEPIIQTTTQTKTSEIVRLDNLIDDIDEMKKDVDAFLESARRPPPHDLAAGFQAHHFADGRKSDVLDLSGRIRSKPVTIPKLISPEVMKGISKERVINDKMSADSLIIQSEEAPVVQTDKAPAVQTEKEVSSPVSSPAEKKSARNLATGGRKPQTPVSPTRKIFPTGSPSSTSPDTKVRSGLSPNTKGATPTFAPSVKAAKPSSPKSPKPVESSVKDSSNATANTATATASVKRKAAPTKPIAPKGTTGTIASPKGTTATRASPKGTTGTTTSPKGAKPDAKTTAGSATSAARHALNSSRSESVSELNSQVTMPLMPAKKSSPTPKAKMENRLLGVSTDHADAGRGEHNMFVTPMAASASHGRGNANNHGNANSPHHEHVVPLSPVPGTFGFFGGPLTNSDRVKPTLPEDSGRGEQMGMTKLSPIRGNGFVRATMRADEKFDQMFQSLQQGNTGGPSPTGALGRSVVGTSAEGILGEQHSPSGIGVSMPRFQTARSPVGNAKPGVHRSGSNLGNFRANSTELAGYKHAHVNPADVTAHFEVNKTDRPLLAKAVMTVGINHNHESQQGSVHHTSQTAHAISQTGHHHHVKLLGEDTNKKYLFYGNAKVIPGSSSRVEGAASKGSSKASSKESVIGISESSGDAYQVPQGFSNGIDYEDSDVPDEESGLVEKSIRAGEKESTHVLGVSNQDAIWDPSQVRIVHEEVEIPCAEIIDANREDIMLDALQSPRASLHFYSEMASVNSADSTPGISSSSKCTVVSPKVTSKNTVASSKNTVVSSKQSSKHLSKDSDDTPRETDNTPREGEFFLSPRPLSKDTIRHETVQMSENSKNVAAVKNRMVNRLSKELQISNESQMSSKPSSRLFITRLSLSNSKSSADIIESVHGSLMSARSETSSKQTPRQTASRVSSKETSHTSSKATSEEPDGSEKNEGKDGRKEHANHFEPAMQELLRRSLLQTRSKSNNSHDVNLYTPDDTSEVKEVTGAALNLYTPDDDIEHDEGVCEIADVNSDGPFQVDNLLRDLELQMEKENADINDDITDRIGQDSKVDLNLYTSEDDNVQSGGLIRVMDHHSSSETLHLVQDSSLDRLQSSCQTLETLRNQDSVQTLVPLTVEVNGETNRTIADMIADVETASQDAPLFEGEVQTSQAEDLQAQRLHPDESHHTLQRMRVSGSLELLRDSSVEQQTFGFSRTIDSSSTSRIERRSISNDSASDKAGWSDNNDASERNTPSDDKRTLSDASEKSESNSEENNSEEQSAIESKGLGSGENSSEKRSSSKASSENNVSLPSAQDSSRASLVDDLMATFNPASFAGTDSY